MPGWIFAFFVVAGSLFAVKMFYVAATAWALPKTMGALYVSTSHARIAAILDILSPAPGQWFVDLGCGDGRVLRMARKRYGVRAVGYELNPLACLKARVMSTGQGIAIRRCDFWQAPVGEADVIFCYLFPDVMPQLSEKIKREARPGSLVVSCNFSLPGFSPERVFRPPGSRHGDPVYIYRVRNREPLCAF